MSPRYMEIFTEKELLQPFTETPEGLSIDLVRKENEKFLAELRKKGAMFTDKALNCLDLILKNVIDPKNSYVPRYTLVPMNLLLWLYELGASSSESERLYRGIAKTVGAAQRSRGVNKMALPVCDLPISRRFAEHMRYAGINFAKNTSKTLPHLAALLTALVFSAIGRALEPEKYVEKALSNAAPLVHNRLLPVPGAIKPRKLFIAVYTEADPVWNTLLFQVCDVAQVVPLCRELVLRAKPHFLSGNKRTQKLSREALIQRLCSYLSISVSETPIETAKYAILGGQKIIW